MLGSPVTPRTAREPEKRRRRTNRGSPMPTADDVPRRRRRPRLFSATNPSTRACVSPLDAPPPSVVHPLAALLRPLARQSRLLLQCLEKGSVRNKGQSAFSGGVFSQKRMRSCRYVSKTGNLNDNERVTRRSACLRVANRCCFSDYRVSRFFYIYYNAGVEKILSNLLLKVLTRVMFYY